jgi:hypothetical protein
MPPQTMPLGSPVTGGSLKCRSHRIVPPRRSHVALKKSGGGGVSVVGSTGVRAAAGATRAAIATTVSRMARITRARIEDIWVPPSFTGRSLADRPFL